MLNLILIMQTFVANAAVSTLDPSVEFREFQTIEVERVRVDNVTGKIDITPVDGTVMSARVRKKRFSDKCSISIEKQDKQVHVRVDGPSFEECEADVEVTAPREVDVIVNAGAGKVNVDGIQGRLAFKLGAGAITAKGSFKEVDGKAGAGSIDVTGINGGGLIESGSGTVKLSFNDKAKGDFKINSGTGDAEVRIPRNTRIRAGFTSGAGSLNNELPTDSRADLGVEMKSGTGDLNIKGY